jgi:hypothetical protein
MGDPPTGTADRSNARTREAKVTPTRAPVGTATADGPGPIGRAAQTADRIGPGWTASRDETARPQTPPERRGTAW